VVILVRHRWGIAAQLPGEADEDRLERRSSGSLELPAGIPETPRAPGAHRRAIQTRAARRTGAEAVPRLAFIDATSAEQTGSASPRRCSPRPPLRRAASASQRQKFVGPGHDLAGFVQVIRARSCGPRFAVSSGMEVSVQNNRSLWQRAAHCQAETTAFACRNRPRKAHPFGAWSMTPPHRDNTMPHGRARGDLPDLPGALARTAHPRSDRCLASRPTLAGEGARDRAFEPPHDAAFHRRRADRQRACRGRPPVGGISQLRIRA
jgi:hypothetical protein